MMKCMKRIGAVVMALAMLVSLCAVGGASVFAISGGGSAGTGSIHAWGCDMSFYNTEGSTNYSLVDYSKMKADGCEFVILRVGYEGSATRANTLDTSFVKLYNMAREAGMHVGVYFYALAKDYAGAVDDAQWCISVFEQYDMYFEYPIYYDVEDPGSSSRPSHESLSSSATTSLCLGWAETLTNAGYFPGVYATAGVMGDLQSSYTNNYDTWIASVKHATTGAQYNPWSENTSFRSTYGAWQYKWYNQGGTQVYAGAYWKDSYGYPLDCNVAFKDYPTIMTTYGYNNMVAKQTVTFESNGGSAVDAMRVTAGEGFTPPADPTRYGFTFAGWYANPELTDVYDFTAAVPEYDFTLYAKWDEAYWGANNNLMPNETQMVLNNFNDQGAIWPYWNNDTYGSVTMYNGVTNDENWSWPSAYMSYENSFDSVNDCYVYVKKDGTAQFNVVITYLDKDGVAHDLYLSDIANMGTDIAAGPHEEFYNVGSYIRNLGHTPASGNVKFTKVTYFVIGPKDSYVKLYDLKFTSKFAIADPYTTMMNSNVQQLSGAGNYVYDNGVLTMNSTAADGYSVKMNIGQTINPSEFVNLLMDVNSTADFNIAVELTNGNGDALMNLSSEYFNEFGLEAAPSALPAGAWTPIMNFIGYYEWNGGVVTESTIKNVTITLVGEGTLTLKAFQASRVETINYVADGAYSNGSLTADPDDYIAGDIDGNGEISTADARMVLQYTIGSVTLTEKQRKAAEFNGDGSISTADARDILISTL